MAAAEPGLLTSILERIAPRLRHPQLFLLVLGLFLLDLLVPDPVPFVDEALLALLTILLGSWRKRPPAGSSTAEESSSAPKDVTDRGSDDGT